MKQLIICVLLFCAINPLRSQSSLGIGLTPAFTFNMNHPAKGSRVNHLDIISNYPSLKAGISLLFETQSMAFTLNTNYHWNKYGWRHTYNNNSTSGSMYNLKEIALSTESISGNLIASLYIKSFFRDKARLLFDIGGGYSIIQHTKSSNSHHKTAVPSSYFSEVLTYHKADVGLDIGSPFVIGGMSIQTILKNIGKIKYGIHYTYYLKALPAMDVDLKTNNEVFTNHFETKHAYFEVFLSYFFLNFKKRDKNSKYHKVSYK